MHSNDTHPLSRILSADQIVCADFVSDARPTHVSHFHSNAWEMISCISGEAEVLKGMQGFRLLQNETLLVQPGMSHSYITANSDTRLLSITFICSSPLLHSFQDRILTVSKTISLQIRELITELRNGFLVSGHAGSAVMIPRSDSVFGAEQMLNLYLEQILIGLYRLSTIAPNSITLHSFPSTEAMHGYLSEMVTFYITQNLSKHLSLDEIAAHFHYSRSRISSIYKAATGITINKAITKERIRRAQYLLEKQEKRVGQISNELGFASPQYFCRCFTKEVGCSPSQYCQMLAEEKADAPELKRLFELDVRDPFLLADNDTYYLYVTRTETYLGKADGFDVYTSKDLALWSGPFPVFTRPEDFWADRHFWAPEVYALDGHYYMLATFNSPTHCRATQILRADSPTGPFLLWSDGPVTPRNWECLHGTLHFENDRPYMVFVHEWLQSPDSEICSIALTPDLRSSIGTPTVLFSASTAPMADKSKLSFTADAPFLYRTKQGILLLLWGTTANNGYYTIVSRSESGTLAGPWVHEQTPLIPSNGYHCMIFRSFEDAIMAAFHRPNTIPHAHPYILELRETETGLAVKQ